MPKLILSPTGTSLLTNLAGSDRQILNKYANSKEGETPAEVKTITARYCNEINGFFLKNDTFELRRRSAELNGIFGIYDDNIQSSDQDVHVLICTDTYQGRTTANLLQQYLQQYFPTTFIYCPVQLSTKNKEVFQTGIKTLLKWCDENLKEYRRNQYEVIFNLTGGFKSLQGYLNTIGMFYADKIVYIFEQSDDLITIPRLPIKIETEIFRKEASLFLQLSNCSEGLNASRVSSIPDLYLEEYGQGKVVLSDWGELSWNQSKEEILSNKLIDLPMVSYSESFKNDFYGINSANEKSRLQEKIAFISCRLQETEGNIIILKGGNSGGILYDNYSGKNNHLGHFRINQGYRVSCNYENKVLNLRHYGNHAYVNDNP